MPSRTLVGIALAIAREIPIGGILSIRGRGSRLAFLCALWLTVGVAEAAQPAAPSAYAPAAVKAAFLHRFASYVDWPPTFSAGEPFTIAVTNDDDVATELGRVLPKLTLQSRQAALRKVEMADDLAGVHILYVAPASIERSRSLIVAAAKRPILIVTDDVGGLASGSVINFVQVGRNIRFEVSLPAAQRNGLRIGSGLLSVATRVEGRP